MEKAEIQFSRMLSDRAEIPTEQQLDVQHRDMHRDWRREIKRVLAFADLPFTAESERAMENYLLQYDATPNHAGHR